MPETAEARAARHGQRMIEVRLRFFTDAIAEGDGHIIPKNAWTSGMVMVQANEAHGIAPGNPRPFNSLLEIGAVVERVLIEHGIKLRPSSKMKRYFKPS